MNLTALIEAILFASDEPVPATRLTVGLGVTEREIQDAASELDKEYESRGISLERVAGGLMIATRPECAAAIEKVLAWKIPVNLSKGALETLAVVAYRQPVTRQDIEGARGVNPEASLDTLLEKGLVREVGRKKSLGRPKLYGTTDEFLKKASLNSTSELPSLSGPASSDEDEGQKQLPLEGPVTLT